MKKFPKLGKVDTYVLKKTFRIMRIILFLLYVGIAQLYAESTYAQNKKLTILLNNVQVEQILDEIENQSKFYFLYNGKLIDLDYQTSVDFTDENIFTVLDQLFAGKDIAYKVIDNQIILSKSHALDQIQRTIRGLVTDKSGAPLPGVTIMVAGTTTGTISDANGNYEISGVGDQSVLRFSLVGMKTREVAVGADNTLNVTMEEELFGLDEVVVVGYGTQKRVNLTGAVATVSSDDLLQRPAPNVQNLLQGKVTGLQVSQSTGKPGDDGSILRIRGLGTFSGAGSDPLILVNGIEGDLQNLDPNDIESVSVLKDAASAAIYGSRAANGVILVTTRKGRQDGLSIEYHGTYQLQEATRLPELVTNSADYMEYWNMARLRGGLTPYFTQEEIDAYRNSTDRVKYPNFDWIDYMFNTASAQTHHLSANGGNDKTTFNVSMGYTDQDGVVGPYNFQKYNMNLNVESKVKEGVTVGANVGFVKRDIITSNFNDNNYDIMNIFASAPLYTPYLSDGSGRYAARYSNAIGEWTVRNPVSVYNSGDQRISRYNATAQVYMSIKLAKGLTWDSKGGFNYDNNFTKNHEHPVDNYYFKDNTYLHNNGVWRLGVQDYMDQGLLTTFYTTLNYNKSVREHNFNVLAGYNQDYKFFRYLAGTREKFPLNSLKELNAGSSENQTTNGTANEWALQSLFARLNYDYKGKYLFEVNTRYDGSSRIAQESRWGIFPSLSAGWRVAEESFMDVADWVDNLKIRASWGQLGNQNVGLYPYQDILTTTSYAFDNVQQGVLLTRLVDKKLKWETTTVTDIGLDLSVKNGLISFTGDWFNKVTDDILYQVPVPASVGLSAPTVNYGKMKNTGYEFDIAHNNQIADFKYGISFNYSTYKNEVLKVLTPSYGNTTIQEGLPWGSHYLLEWIGIFQSEEDIANSPSQWFNPKPGDLKFKDQNGDGRINLDDRVVHEGAHPKFTYGGNVFMAWKNFDLNAFFQGVEGVKHLLIGWGFDPFMQGSAPTKDFVKKMWTPENPTNKAPAMYYAGYAPVWGVTSTYYLHDASYLRLKNLTLGYQVPKSICSKISAESVRFYVSGDNLITITKFPGSDPERAGQGDFFSVYPQIRTYAFGVKVKF